MFLLTLDIKLSATNSICLTFGFLLYLIYLVNTN